MAVAMRLPKVFETHLVNGLVRTIRDAQDIDEAGEAQNAQRLKTMPEERSRIAVFHDVKAVQHGSYFIPPAAIEKEENEEKPVDGNQAPAMNWNKFGDLAKKVQMLGDGEGEAENLSAVELGTTITDIRQGLRQRIRAVMLHHQTKKSAYNVFQEVVKKMGEEHVEVKSNNAVSALQKFEAGVQELKEVEKAMPNWTADSMQQHVERASKILDKAETSMDKILVNLLEKLKGVKNEESRNANADRRRVGTAMRSYFGNGALMKQGAPKMITNYLGEMVLKFNLADNAPTDEVALNKVSDNTFDPRLSSPMLFTTEKPPDEMNPGQLMAKQFSECVSGNATMMVKKLKEHLEQDERKDVFTNLARVVIPREPGERFFKLQWIPEAFLADKGEAFKPSHLPGIGAPQMMYQKQWGYRYGNALLPIVGMGSLVMCVQGKVLMLITS